MYKSGYSTFFLSKCGSRSCLLAQSSQKMCKYLTDRTLTTSEHKRRIPVVAAPVAGAYVVGIASNFQLLMSLLSLLNLLHFLRHYRSCSCSNSLNRFSTVRIVTAFLMSIFFEHHSHFILIYSTAIIDTIFTSWVLVVRGVPCQVCEIRLIISAVHQIGLA